MVSSVNRNWETPPLRPRLGEKRPRSAIGVSPSRRGPGRENARRESYQLVQSIIRNDKIDGVAIDRNLTKSDNFGGSVLWLSTS
jgi:hypothetical protein